MMSTWRLMPDSQAETESPPEVWFLPQDSFLRMLSLERKRTDRSHRKFVLMLLESDRLLRGNNHADVFENVVEALLRSTRETDVKGWYRASSVIGVIFTELGAAEAPAVANDLLAKVLNALGRNLGLEQVNEIRISFHVYPEDWENGGGGGSDAVLYPDLQAGKRNGGARALKRAMDVAGSACALIFLAPVFAAIAALIKLTSRGPVLFRQERIGQYGRRFTFLKFRSMYAANDPAIHEEYVEKLIAGAEGAERKNGAYKLTDDPRVTPLGRFLRRTSLDELPQFLNVLKGEMSLVGPRPPIPYEFQRYDLWHRRRVLTVKPGITGKWQVEGRSRVPFNEMVRMDLEYARSWTPWGDLKILARTPAAMISGGGAY